jgi:hypothetical protein
MAPFRSARRHSQAVLPPLRTSFASKRTRRRCGRAELGPRCEARLVDFLPLERERANSFHTLGQAVRRCLPRDPCASCEVEIAVLGRMPARRQSRASRRMSETIHSSFDRRSRANPIIFRAKSRGVTCNPCSSRKRATGSPAVEAKHAVATGQLPANASILPQSCSRYRGGPGPPLLLGVDKIDNVFLRGRRAS